MGVGESLTHPAMLLMERLLERLFPWNVMMLVCLLACGIIREDVSSGERMADQGRSRVPPAVAESAHISNR